MEDFINLDTTGSRFFGLSSIRGKFHELGYYRWQIFWTKLLFVSDIMCLNIAIRKVVLLADNGSK